jgi:S-adenosylmethionine:tRNA ribosyltransferase-isomerase
MKTSDFDYNLPQELIAQTPAEPRDASRLLVVDRATGQLAHRRFADIHEYLRPGDLLVGNNSRVIPARLHGLKETGGSVEILLLKPHLSPASDVAQDGNSLYKADRSGAVWQCLVGGKGLRPGVRVRIRHGSYPNDIVATVVTETDHGGRIIAFDPPVARWLWDVGETPLPPYIHEPLADAERYQTVYSRIDGSVASSTAGLHFTPELLVRLRERATRFATVTLHIGLDTFRPVQAENVSEHQIHREWAELPAETARAINETRLAGGRVIAIGTTVVRTLESAAKIALGFRPCDEIPDDAVCGWQAVAAFEGETDLFITPGFRFRAVDAMITNFHLPRSTLLMLVSAFAGKGLIDRAYAHAIRERYRFYSFGDAMLIL